MAVDDVVQNSHLWVFPTDAGFGGTESADVDITGNPLLEWTDEHIGDQRLRANDVFRIVHDYFGHIKDGFGFRADGEENAWQSHAAMFSPLARRALTSETRGQNSWVNYGPFGAFNKTASAGETQYAPQKIGLLPEWVSSEGFVGGANSGLPVGQVLGQGPIASLAEVQALAADLKVELEVEETGGEEGNIALQWIKRAPRKKGSGARVLEALIAYADLTGQTITLGITDDKNAAFLEGYYESYGFERDDPFDDYDRIMTRYPRGAQDASLYQSEVEPNLPFYSALIRAVAASQTKSAPASQWLATLRKTPGVKAEEIEWSGLEEWLNGVTEPVGGMVNPDAKGNVRREDVLTFLQNGGVKVEEVVLGGGETAVLNTESRFFMSSFTSAIEGARDREDALLMLDNDRRAYETARRINADLEDGGLFEDGDLSDTWAETVLDDLLVSFEREDAGATGPAQFANYKLPGADDSYREILLTLPNIDGPSTHWDEPNVVAHARITTRTDATGAKVLFLEEVQSDWHQKGRDEGYRREATAEERAAADQTVEDARAALVAAEQAMLPAAERIINARLDFYEQRLAELRERGVDKLAEQDLRDVAVPADRDAIQEFRRIERQLDINEDLLNAADSSSGELRNRAAVRAAFDTPGWGPNVGLPMPTEAERAAAGHISAGLRYQEAQLARDALEGGGIPNAPFQKSLVDPRYEADDPLRRRQRLRQDRVDQRQPAERWPDRRRRVVLLRAQPGQRHERPAEEVWGAGRAGGYARRGRACAARRTNRPRKRNAP